MEVVLVCTSAISRISDGNAAGGASKYRLSESSALHVIQQVVGGPPESRVQAAQDCHATSVASRSEKRGCA